MIQNYIENANFEDTGFAYTLSLISGKHKMVILYCLMEFKTVRFNELKRYLKTISDKTLSTNLKELESDKLIIRTEYPQIPPKVEYCLSERGKSLMVVLDQLCVWGEENKLTDQHLLANVKSKVFELFWLLLKISAYIGFFTQYIHFQMFPHSCPFSHLQITFL